MTKNSKLTIGSFLIKIIFVIWSVVVLYPILWAVFSSLKDNMSIFSSPWALPVNVHFENYYNAWVSAKISTYFLNSLLVVGGTIFLLMLMAATTAYVLAKFDFHGRTFIENLYVACMGIPMVLVLVPLFFIAHSMHLMRVRVLRQTDVLLLMYLLNDSFTQKQKLAAFKYYEPITTHDSSLSYNTHCIMAAELGMEDKAEYYFYKTCRLDLDDEFNTVRSGLHGASMGGTWMSVVNGLAGFRIKDGVPSFKPMIPKNWESVSFKMKFLGKTVAVKITNKGTKLTLLEGKQIKVLLNNEKVLLKKEGKN